MNDNPQVRILYFCIILGASGDYSLGKSWGPVGRWLSGLPSWPAVLCRGEICLLLCLEELGSSHMAARAVAAACGMILGAVKDSIHNTCNFIVVWGPGKELLLLHFLFEHPSCPPPWLWPGGRSVLYASASYSDPCLGSQASLGLCLTGEPWPSSLLILYLMTALS